MTTPNIGIPEVPEGTLDPAAGLNDSLRVLDALVQTAVITIGDNAPPGTSSDGDLYIVGDSPTGDWAGHARALARFVLEGTFWQFYAAGTQVKIVLNRADGRLYLFNSDSSPGSWEALGAAITVRDEASPQTIELTGEIVVGDGLILEALTGGGVRISVAP